MRPAPGSPGSHLGQVKVILAEYQLSGEIKLGHILFGGSGGKDQIAVGQGKNRVGLGRLIVDPEDLADGIGDGGAEVA